MTEPHQGFYINSIGWVLSMFGWIVIYLINVKTLNRNEVSRQRESIKTQISELLNWLNELLFDDKLQNYSDQNMEEIMEAKVSQIEFRINAFNKFTGKDVFSTEKLAKFQIAADQIHKGIVYKAIINSYDLLEYTEITFDEYISSRNRMILAYVRYRHELHGALAGLNLLALWWFVSSSLLST